MMLSVVLNIYVMSKGVMIKVASIKNHTVICLSLCYHRASLMRNQHNRKLLPSQLLYVG